MDSLEDDWEQSLATTFDIDKLSLKLSDIENASFEFGAGSIIASDTDNAKEVQYQDLFPEALSTPTVFLEDRKSFTLSDRRKWEDMQKSYMTLRQLHEGSSKKLQEAKEIIKKLRQQISVQSKEGLFLKKCLKQASLQKKQLEMQLSAAQKQSKQRSSTPTASFARNDPLTSVSVITAAKTQMAKSHEKLEGTLVENKLLEAALEVKASDFGLTREEIRSGLLCELVSLRETTRKLRSENDMIRSKFRELELRYNRIKVDIKYHQSAAVDANKTTDMAKKSTDEMIGMLEKTKDELARLKAELDEAQKAIRNKDAEFSRIKDEHANTVRALELNASELRIEIEREKQKNEHHSHVMEMTKDEIVKSHKREIERLHSEMEAAQKHYESKYSAQAKKLESKIEKMKQEFQKDVSSYKKLLEEEKKKLNEQADKSKQGLLGELELLHKSIAKERQSWATERDELEKAHNEAMQRMLSDMDKQLQRIHEQQAIIVREREKIPQLEEKIRQLKDREADLLRQLDRLHDEGVQQKKRNGTLTNEITDLHDELTKECERSDQILDELRALRADQSGAKWAEKTHSRLQNSPAAKDLSPTHPRNMPNFQSPSSLILGSSFSSPSISSISSSYAGSRSLPARGQSPIKTPASLKEKHSEIHFRKAQLVRNPH